MSPLFWLYRVPGPGLRAQAIQVVHAAHAAASLGHEVSLFLDQTNDPSSPRDALAWYGLRPSPQLKVIQLPRGTAASLRFWAEVLAFWVRHRRRGVYVARSKRYAQRLLRALPQARVLLETHELDSALAAERGEEPRAAWALERWLVSRVGGLLANAPGTLRAWEAEHPCGDLPRCFAHNATRADRVRAPIGEGEGIGYYGSALGMKDVETLGQAVPQLPLPLVVGGPPSPGRQALAVAGARVCGEVPFGELPDHLAQRRLLLLPAGNGLFGRELTSPLKGWDYQASGRPIVAANTPALRHAAPGAVAWYEPGQAASLVEAVRAGLARPAAVPVRLRTWQDRAQEVGQLLLELR